jgi:hypothetical protein
MRCDFKTLHECSCKDGECAETRVTPAPVVLISLKTQALTCIAIGIVTGISVFAAAYRAEPYFKTQDLIAQESRHG